MKEEHEPCLLIVPFRKHTYDELDQIADFLSRMGYKVFKKKCKTPCKDKEEIIKIGEKE